MILAPTAEPVYDAETRCACRRDRPSEALTVIRRRNCTARHRIVTVHLAATARLNSAELSPEAGAVASGPELSTVPIERLRLWLAQALVKVAGCE